MYNRALCMHTNVRTCMDPQWKPLHPLCSCSGYGSAAESNGGVPPVLKYNNFC